MTAATQINWTPFNTILARRAIVDWQISERDLDIIKQYLSDGVSKDQIVAYMEKVVPGWGNRRDAMKLIVDYVQHGGDDDE